jgi:N-acetylmuramoyl-L-alanine amidase
MNLQKLILTNNACFKAGKTITPKGIMVHSTGANNPWLKRYVGPDDGLLGKNQNNNHWNQDRPDGRQVCVHAFIGKLAAGTIATYQTLPWNHRGWHAGGDANNTHIGFEICEDGLSDSTYFNKVYREAVELCVFLCREYGLTEKNIICHSEGYKLGIASNHSDVMHWFSKHGKLMDTFRAEVKKALTPIKPSPKKEESALPYEIYTVVKGDSLWKIAKEQLGNGERYTEIKALNGLTSNIIYVGQKLKIPN